jgi:3-hydroxyacyl-CoA dehydrogenase
MGAGIAAQVANAGLPVLLLDIAPAELTPEEKAKGLTLESPAVRNRVVQAGFERARKARPAAFMSPAAERLVKLGNIEDDLAKVAEADWIIEVIIEQLEPKQALMARIEAVRKPGSIVSSNTSGLPIASIAAGRTDEFKRHFLGTHFFNPPRYMKLLEVIPTAETDPALVQTISQFAEERLGKGVVLCKDTPNFIGNRLFSISNAFAVNYGLENGYTVQEVDDLTGPLLGRPKTATFRLLDLVGIDVAAYVAQNLYGLIPDDPYREMLRGPFEKLLGQLIDRKWLGNKSGQGFYKQGKDAEGKRVFLTLNPDRFDYEIPAKTNFESVSAVRKTQDLGQRLAALLSEQWREDRGAQYAWALIGYELAYASACAPEIAHDLKSIDDAIRWGFNYEVGPFQLWDMLGVPNTIRKLEASGLKVASWVEEMLAAGCETFYRVENSLVTGYYDWDAKQYKNMPANARQVKLGDLRHKGRVLHQNSSASLLDMGDGVLLLEFHAKMNAIDDELIKMMGQAKALLDEEDKYVGLVIGNEGENFCVGANLFVLGMAAQQGMVDQLDQMAKTLQTALRAFRYSHKPVVAAVHNRALGGGAEIVLNASRVVAHAESYIGLVETGLGLVPAGGGVTALVRRILSAGMQVEHTDPLPLAQKIFEIIGMAKTGASAAGSREWGYLGPDDRIVMNRDHLLYEAKREVLNMIAGGYTPPAPALLYAGGRDLKAALQMGVWLMEQAGYISDHDKLVGQKLAHIICGGDLSGPQWVGEQYFLDLEREAFIDLIKTEKSQARIWYMLENNKPLRN